MKRFASLGLILLVFFQLGFDLSRSSIPRDEILSGGPPKDGIPALTDPEFISVEDVDFLRPWDRVLGIELNGESKAYPILILNWHELVNDQLEGVYFLISYCPLCGTGMAFDPWIHGERYLFGVSGKLYNSDVLFYDKKTESLWSQLKMEAVTGKLMGTRLKHLKIQHTTWKDWKNRYPGSQVLSPETGYDRAYSENPYARYEATEKIMFPVSNFDRRLPMKTWVLGVLVNEKAKAYSFEALKEESSPFQDRIGGVEVEVQFNSEHRWANIFDSEGEEIPSTQAYWFAWAAFHPDTELWNS